MKSDPATQSQEVILTDAAVDAIVDLLLSLPAERPVDAGI